MHVIADTANFMKGLSIQLQLRDNAFWRQHTQKAEKWHFICLGTEHPFSYLTSMYTAEIVLCCCATQGRASKDLHDGL